MNKNERNNKKSVATILIVHVHEISNSDPLTHQGISLYQFHSIRE